MSLLISLRSELLKTKRTSLLYLCVCGAALVPVMTLFFDNESPESLATLKLDPWVRYLDEGSKVLSVVMLPMYIILICTLLPQLEFRNNAWKQVLTSPQSLGNIFAAKFLTIQLFILAFIVLFTLFTMASLLGVHFFRFNLDLFQRRPDWHNIATTNGTIYLTVLAVSGLQFWFGLRFKSFLAPVGIGFCLWVLAMMSAMEYHWPHASKIPYAFSLLALFPKYAAKVPLMLWSSLGYCIVFLTLAFLEFKMKKIKA
ncbi:MAG: ABC transporter permease [Ferruginibacter sp.]|nr:ABC transporter permease [Ferruginibacter sp.]